jgi:hypothetical protein
VGVTADPAMRISERMSDSTRWFRFIMVISSVYLVLSRGSGVRPFSGCNVYRTAFFGDWGILQFLVL